MDPDSWRQAKSVLEAALLCPPDEREALIAARCADASLRHEVLACLNENDESFLESALTISHTFDHATSGDDVEPAPDIQPGERIGRYKVERRLGAGGMGAVFLCTDTELRRPVALKCLISSASAVDIRARLRHEASAAAQLNHPNIAAVHDVVEHDGRPFLVMEYVEGEDLAHALKRERPALDRILAIGRQLASALTAAHAKNIIHRDLKPANVQLMPDGSVKILDFGVAQAMWLADSEPAGGAATTGVPLSTLATQRTERGSIRHPGTPAYMSPEQMFGKPIDGRSDIYSLGVILYEMATGHRPYSTDDPLDVVLALSHKLLRPSGTETHLPEAVNDIIGKMLAVSPEERYQAATEVEAAIVALITPEASPIDAGDVGIWTRIPRLVRAAIWVGLVPITLGTLGFATTAAYNVMLVRKAPFDAEPVSAWIVMGLRSIVTPVLVYVAPLLVAFWAARFVLRLLSLARPVETLLTNSRTQSRRLWLKVGLTDPVVLAQSIAMVGVVALAVILWTCRDVFLASVTIVPTFPELADRMKALQPGHNGYAHLYRFVLSNLAAALLFATVRLSRLLWRQPNRRGAGALVAIVALLLVVVALAEVPYRVIGRNEAERVMLADERCYEVGQTADQLLLFCPDRNPPRNTVVASTDPSVERSGAFESIFTPRKIAR